MISPELVNEVEARMNRQHTPPSLFPINSTATVGMSMNTCPSVNVNSQSRPKPSSRERRSGLATVMEGLRLGVLGMLSLKNYDLCRSRNAFRFLKRKNSTMVNLVLSCQNGPSYYYLEPIQLPLL